MAGTYTNIHRHPDGTAVGRLLPDGTLEIPLQGAWIRLGWVTPDGSVFHELHPESRYGWVTDGVGYRASHPHDAIVLVTSSGVIRDHTGEVAGMVHPPHPLAGAALFVAMSL